MNDKSGRKYKYKYKYKGSHTIKKTSGPKSNARTYRKRHINTHTNTNTNNSISVPQLGGGFGKKKTPEEKAANEQAKSDKKNAEKLAKEEKQKKEADKKAAIAEEKKKKDAAKIAEKAAAEKKLKKQEKQLDTGKPANEAPKQTSKVLNLAQVPGESNTEDDSGAGPVLKLEGQTPGEESTDASVDEPKETPAGVNLEPELADETSTDDEPETPAETKEDQPEEAKKPWYKKARNTLKKGTNSIGDWATEKGQKIKENWEEFAEGAKERPFKTMGNILKSPVKLYKKTAFKVGQKLTGIKKWAANAADTISPKRQIQRYKTWSRRTTKANSDVKFNKYIDIQIERQQKIDKLEVDRANIMAKKGMSVKDRNKLLANLDKQIKSEKQKKEYDEAKAAEWKGKQNRAETAMTLYADELAYKSAPVKAKINENLKKQETTILNSSVAKEIAQKEIDAEIEAEFKTQRQTAITALEQDKDYSAAKKTTESNVCKKPPGEQTDAEKADCQAAEKTLTAKTGQINTNIETAKAAVKKEKEAEIRKRILKNHSMELIGKDLNKLTKAMRLPSAISTPGTREHTELQDKIRAHIDQHGKMPPADEISKMVAGTAYEQTLTNTAKSMALEVKNSLTSRKAVYKDSSAALASISHPMAKTGVINQSIQEFIPKLETEIKALSVIPIRKSGETDADYKSREAERKSQLTTKQTVLRTVKQMTAAGEPAEQINKFIGRYDTKFKDTVLAKTNNLNTRAAGLQVGSDANDAAVQKYYDAEMAKLGYPEMTTLLLEFAKQYYIGPPLKKNQNLTIADVAKALRYYKNTILPFRIANNPYILNKLQTNKVSVPSPVIANTAIPATTKSTANNGTVKLKTEKKTGINETSSEA